MALSVQSPRNGRVENVPPQPDITDGPDAEERWQAKRDTDGYLQKIRS